MKCVSKPRPSETTMDTSHLNYFIHNKENVILCSPANATLIYYFLLGLLFDPEVEAVLSSEISVDFYRSIWLYIGRAIAQAVRRRLPTAAARVQTRV
jgi:hypothetical protein